MLQNYVSMLHLTEQGKLHDDHHADFLFAEQDFSDFISSSAYNDAASALNSHF